MLSAADTVLIRTLQGIPRFNELTSNWFFSPGINQGAPAWKATSTPLTVKSSLFSRFRLKNSIAVSLGLCKPEYVEDVIKNIVDDCIAKGKHSTSGNQGYRHFFYVLAQAGYTQLLIEVLKNRDYPGWGHMLEEDGTTIWERWETEIKLEMHSFDHPMFGSFDGLFYHYLGGIVIDDDACGCDKITINPHFNNDLTFVKAHMDTVRGRIATAWEKKDGVVVLKLRVPHTVTAKLDFVGKINGVAFEKGKLVGGGEYEIEIEA